MGARGAWRSLSRAAVEWPGAATVVLVFLCLVFFWRFITPDLGTRGYFEAGDFYEHYYPWRYYATEELANGRLPLWSPYVFSGHPFLADVQTAVLYPPHLLLALLHRLAGNPTLSTLTLEWLVIAHFVLAIIFTYLFAKHVTKSVAGGVAAACVFGFGSYLTSYPLLQLNIIEAVTWLPLALLFVTLAIEKRSVAYWSLAGAALAFSLLAGHPQQSVYVYYTVGAYAVFLGLVRARGEGIVRRAALVRRWLPVAGGLGLCFGMAIGLAAMQLVPSVEFARVSTRAAISYDFASTGFGLREALGFLLPNAQGGKAMYVGILPLFLAACSLFCRASRRAVLFWLGAAIVAYVLAFGGELPLYRLFHAAVPGLATFRSQERAISIFSFALAVLAAYGLTALIGAAPKERDTRLRWLGLAGLGVAAVSGAGTAALAAVPSLGPFLEDALLHRPEQLPNLAPDLLHLSVFAALAAGVFLAWRRWNTAVVSPLIIAIIALDLFIVNWGNVAARGEVPGLFARTPVVEFLQSQKGGARVELGDITPNAGLVLRVPTVRGAGPLAIHYLAQAVDTPYFWRVWQLLNTGYFVSYVDKEAAKPLFRDGNIGVYGPAYDIASAYVAFRTQVVDDDEALGILAPQPPATSTFAYGRDALLAKPVVQEAAGRGFTRRARLISLDSTRIAVEVDTTAPGVLVVSEVFYPGWRAFVDGREAEIVRSNYLLRGVPVPAGAHLVQIVYEPMSAKMGAVLSILSLALVVALVLWGGSRRRRALTFSGTVAVGALAAFAVWRALTPMLVTAQPADREGIAQYLRQQARAGDALVASSSALTAGLELPGVTIYDGPSADPTTLAGRHGRVWRLLELEEGTEAAYWPAAVLQKTDGVWQGPLHLALYVPPESLVPQDARRLQATFGESVDLIGSETSRKDVLAVTLYWRGKRELGDDYSVFVHVIDRSGVIVAQHDGQPQNAGRPTSTWEDGEVVRDEHVVVLPPGLPPGEYRLATGMYAVATGKRLTLGDGRDILDLGGVDLP